MRTRWHFKIKRRCVCTHAIRISTEHENILHHPENLNDSLTLMQFASLSDSPSSSPCPSSALFDVESDFEISSTTTELCDREDSFCPKKSSSSSPSSSSSSSLSNQDDHSCRSTWSGVRQRFLTSSVLLFSFFGPAQLVAVGYIDPGNWATDLAAGAQAGYIQLVVVIFCNICAIILQLLCMKLGVVSGRDLAQQCRLSLHPYANIALWLSCELAIVATDIAEVIGSAVALKLLFGCPIWLGILITGLDVFIILIGLRDKLLYIEIAISLMVFGVFGGLVSIVFKSSPNVMEMILGCLPIHPKVITDPTTLAITIGIIGATIMPHNLYLHSALAREHFRESVLNRTIEIPLEDNDSSQDEQEQDPMIQQAQARKRGNQHQGFLQREEQEEEEEDQEERALSKSNATIHTHEERAEEDSEQAIIGADDKTQFWDASLLNPSDCPNSHRSLDEANETATQHQSSISFIEDEKEIRTFLFRSAVGLTVSLSLACIVNGSILVVSASQFHKENEPSTIPGLIEAYDLLKVYLGPIWAVLFASSLLLAGQSSTITGTMAGSIVMEGFLDMKISPWLRRLITRSIAITPALIVVLAFGEEKLDALLVFSQIVLSFQLPFSITPLVYFISKKSIMGIHANGVFKTVSCYLLGFTLALANFVSLYQLFFY